MDLIEKAAKRLEELRRAGVGTAAEAALPAGGATTAAKPDHLPTPEAAMRGMEAAQAKLATTPSTPLAPAATPATDSSPPGLAVVPLQAAPAAIIRPNASAPSPVAPAAAPRVSVAAASVPPAKPGTNTSRAPVVRVELDLRSLEARGFVTPDAAKSQIAEEFRIVKRPIIGNVVGASGAKIVNRNLVMVTSALPGEGKTFTAINLAMSIAMEINTTVLLVDGDVAHPDLPRILGIPSSPGLLDVLTRDDIDVGDAIVRTNIENLSILPAGSRHRRSTELLASEQMAMLLRELAQRYSDRVIIFDSPPLLPTTEARVLATHMGQIVMVVAADNTRQHAVSMALSTIERCEIVLMMLNKAERSDVGTYYDYYADDPPRK